ncbi:MAG: hypothetical protein Fur0039_24830 [Rhodocyclaceae bacterium]
MRIHALRRTDQNHPAARLVRADRCEFPQGADLFDPDLAAAGSSPRGCALGSLAACIAFPGRRDGFRDDAAKVRVISRLDPAAGRAPATSLAGGQRVRAKQRPRQILRKRRLSAIGRPAEQQRMVEPVEVRDQLVPFRSVPAIHSCKTASYYELFK